MNTAWERKCSTSTRTRNLYSIEIVLAKEKENAVNMTFGRLFLSSSRRMGASKKTAKAASTNVGKHCTFHECT